MKKMFVKKEAFGTRKLAKVVHESQYSFFKIVLNMPWLRSTIPLFDADLSGLPFNSIPCPHKKSRTNGRQNSGYALNDFRAPCLYIHSDWNSAIIVVASRLRATFLSSNFVLVSTTFRILNRSLPIKTVKKSTCTSILNAELTWFNEIFLTDFGFPDKAHMSHTLNICHRLLPS